MGREGGGGKGGEGRRGGDEGRKCVGVRACAGARTPTHALSTKRPVSQKSFFSMFVARLLLRNRGFAVSLYVVSCPLWSALWFAVHNMGCSVLFRVLVWCYVCRWSCCRCCLGCMWLRGCVGVCCVALLFGFPPGIIR